MPAPTTSTIYYTPGVPPTDPKELPRYLGEEFNRISAAINMLKAGHLDISYTAPLKPRAGDIRYAAGAPYWNPGSGEGIYRYTIAGAWAFVG